MEYFNGILYLYVYFSHYFAEISHPQKKADLNWRVIFLASLKTGIICKPDGCC